MLNDQDKTTPNESRLFHVLRDNSWQFIWGFVGAFLALVTLFVTLRATSPASPLHQVITGDSATATLAPSATPFPTFTAVPTATISLLTPTTNAAASSSQTFDMHHLALQCQTSCQGYVPITFDSIQVTPGTVTFSFTLTSNVSYTMVEHLDGYLEDIDGNQYNMDGIITETQQIPANQQFTFLGTFDLTPIANKHYIFHPNLWWSCPGRNNGACENDAGHDMLVVTMPF